MNLEDLATKQDIAALNSQISDLKTIIQQLVGTTANDVFSISQIQKMGVLGGYDRIKRLIKKGRLKSIDGTKVTRQALNECLYSLNFQTKP